ncbi:cytochrome P450 [Nocardia blacklockiae]|uniref:cytochrome P450 n=1 Tax=Nocardia blacklockiae TaxID=480036 RepID=UPI001895D10A|nr:cytochrome P450 [Nocardia blacklockiae]MBF6176106.1 cytochrome P450 [Nocardia blacklockiae]
MNARSTDPRPRVPRLTLAHALWAGIDFERYFRWRRERDGDPFFVRFPGFGAVLFTGTASGAKELLRAPREILEPPQPNPIEPLVGSASLILARAARHRRERTLLAPAFHRDRIRRYGTVIREATVDELAGAGCTPPWRPGTRVDARAAARAITLRVILGAVFGVDDPHRRAEYTAAVGAFLTAFSGPLMLVPALRRGAFDRAPWDRFEAARARLDALIDADIARRRGTGEPGADILGMLLHTRYDDGTGISDEDLRDHLRTMLVAGHETTATSLVWALFRLHRQPDTLRRLRAELDDAGELPPDELARLPYLDAVCHETLRLHPPVPIVLRRLTEPFALSGVALAAGDTMGIALPLLHSDPAIWAEPSLFRPERFLERHYGPLEFAPYGGGHRRCLGAALADYELRIVLGTLLTRVVPALSPRYARGRIPLAVPHNIATGPHAGITFDIVSACPRSASRE